MSPEDYDLLTGKATIKHDASKIEPYEDYRRWVIRGNDEATK